MSQEEVKVDLTTMENASVIVDSGEIDSSQSDNIKSGANKTSRNSAQQRSNMGKFTVLKSGDIHCGPSLVLKEAICIKDLKRSELVNINESCKNCENEKQEKTITGRIKKFQKKWTLTRCFMFGVIITLTEIFVLACLYFRHTSSIENGLFFINVQKIDVMQGNLVKFIPREIWTQGKYNSTNCSYQCPKIKSKVRFVLSSEISFMCNKGVLCLLQLEGNSINAAYKDIYYNYLIMGEGMEIYEGRALTCPHDETFLTDDHSSLVTVAIHYCFPGRSERNLEFSLRVTDAISNLVTNLKENDMLDKGYVLDFPDVCKNSPLLERIRRVPGIGSVSFYKYEMHKKFNVSAEMNPTTISKLLFSPEDKPNKENYSVSGPRVKLQLPFPRNISINNIDYSTDVYRITLRFYSCLDYSGECDSFTLYNSVEHFLQLCWPGMLSILGEEISTFDTSIGNYFVFYDLDVVYGQIPVNYLNNLNQTDLVVNVFILHPFVLIHNSYKRIMWFAQVMESIRNDVRKRIKYSQVDFEYSCRMDDFTEETTLIYDNNTVLFIYDYLLDRSIRSVRYMKTGDFITVSKCKNNNEYLQSADELYPSYTSKPLFFLNEMTGNDSESDFNVYLTFPFSSDIRFDIIGYSPPDVSRITLRLYAVDTFDIDEDVFQTDCINERNFVPKCWHKMMNLLGEERSSFDTSISNYYVYDGQNYVYGQIPVNYWIRANLNHSGYVVNIVVIYNPLLKDFIYYNRVLWFNEAIGLIRNDVRKRIKYSKINFEYSCRGKRLHHNPVSFIFQDLLDVPILYVQYTGAGSFSNVSECRNIYNSIDSGEKLNPTIKSNLLLVPKDTTEISTTSIPYIKLEFPFSSSIPIDNINYSTDVNKITIRFYFVSPFYFNIDSDLKDSVFVHKNFIIDFWPKLISSLGEERLNLDKSIGNYLVFDYLDLVYGQIPVTYCSKPKDSDFVANVILFNCNRCERPAYRMQDYNKILWFSQVMKSISNDISKRIKYSQVDFEYSCRGGTSHNDNNTVLYIYDYLLHTPVRPVQYTKARHFITISECEEIHAKNLPDRTSLDPTIVSKLLFLWNDTSSENESTSSSYVKLEFPFSGNISTNDIDYSTEVFRVSVRFYVVYSYYLDLYPDFTQCISGENFVRHCWPKIISYLGKETLSFDSSIGNYYAFEGLDVVYGQIPVNFSTNLNHFELIVNVVQFYYYTDQIHSYKTIKWFAQVMESIRKDVRKRIKYSQVDFQYSCHGERNYNNNNTALFIYNYLLDRPISSVQYMRSGNFSSVSKCGENYKNLDFSDIINTSIKSKHSFLPNGKIVNDLASIPQVKIYFPFSSNIRIPKVDNSTCGSRITLRFHSKIFNYTHFDPSCGSVYTCKEFTRKCWPKIMNYLGEEKSTFDKSIVNYFVNDYSKPVCGQIPLNYRRSLYPTDFVVNVFQIYNPLRTTAYYKRIHWIHKVLDSILNDLRKIIKYSQVDFEYSCHGERQSNNTLLFVFKHLLDRPIRYVQYTGVGRFSKVSKCRNIYNNIDSSDKLTIAVNSNLLLLPKNETENSSASLPYVKLEFPFSSNIPIDKIEYSSTNVNKITIRFYFIHTYYFNIDPDLTDCFFVNKNFVPEFWPKIISSLGEEGSSLAKSIGNYYVFDYLDVMYGQIPVRNWTNPKDNDFVVNVILLNCTRRDLPIEVTPDYNWVLWFSEVMKSISNDISSRIKHSQVDFEYSCHDALHNDDNAILYLYDYLLDRPVRPVQYTKEGHFNSVSKCEDIYIKNFTHPDILYPTIMSKLSFLSNDLSSGNDFTSSERVKLEFLFSSNISSDNIGYSRDIRRVVVRFYVIYSYYLDLYSNFTQCISGDHFVRKCLTQIMSYLGKESLSFDTSIGNYYAFDDLDVVYGQIPENYLTNLTYTDNVINVVLSLYYTDHINNYKTIRWFSQVMESIRNDVRKRIRYSRVDYQISCHAAPVSDNSPLYMYYILLGIPMRYVEYTASGHFVVVSGCIHYNFDTLN